MPHLLLTECLLHTKWQLGCSGENKDQCGRAQRLLDCLDLRRSRHKAFLILLAHLNAQTPCYRFLLPSNCIENAKESARRVSVTLENRLTPRRECVDRTVDVAGTSQEDNGGWLQAPSSRLKSPVGMQWQQRINQTSQSGWEIVAGNSVTQTWQMWD